MKTDNYVTRKNAGRGFELSVTLKGDAASLEAFERIGTTIAYGTPSRRRWEFWRNPWKVWCAVLLTAFAFELPILVARAFL